MRPFLYFAGDRLSSPELMAACLDGHLVELGEGFMPADAVETRELRAASLRALMTTGLALTHASAAWVHGAAMSAPRRHCVQRTSERRGLHVVDVRLRYRDGRLPPEDLVIVSGVAVTTPERTLADLVRDDVLHDRTGTEVVDALITTYPALPATALAQLERSGPLHRKRAALAYLRERAARCDPNRGPPASQDEVTR
ncbi:type IV toxin-antitoxin system AbiEi family antitoxin [Microbacterium sp.]|uniref:type IV toxin-antitoxin system AbiEi family antitoxin n=1 Tax=Microbacterium sp. TaxID=51671 RepID=UPI0039E3E2CA